MSSLLYTYSENLHGVTLLQIEDVCRGRRTYVFLVEVLTRTYTCMHLVFQPSCHNSVILSTKRSVCYTFWKIKCKSSCIATFFFCSNHLFYFNLEQASFNSPHLYNIYNFNRKSKYFHKFRWLRHWYVSTWTFVYLKFSSR